MNRKKLNHIIIKRMEGSNKVFHSKNDEYANESEVFQNFKDGMGMSYNNTPEKYAWELLVKHLQSIKDILTDVEKNKIPSFNLLDEKFNDAHNYLYLIEGMIVEKKDVEELGDMIDSEILKTKIEKQIDSLNPTSVVDKINQELNEQRKEGSRT